MSAENVELEGQMTLFEDEIENNEEQIENPSNELGDNDEFKEAVYEQMRKIHNQGLVVGFQTACHTALDKIYAFERKAGKKSMNDYKRCIKDLKTFCEVGTSRTINEVMNDEENDDEVTSAEVETTQN